MNGIAHVWSWVTSVVFAAIAMLLTVSAAAQTLGPLTDVQVEVGEKVRVIRVDETRFEGN